MKNVEQDKDLKGLDEIYKRLVVKASDDLISINFMHIFDYILSSSFIIYTYIMFIIHGTLHRLLKHMNTEMREPLQYYLNSN